jgi:hypothetical protein
MPIRRVLAILWAIGAFLLMLAGWAFYAGPFRWAAEWQLEHFGSYEIRITLFGPLIVLLIPAGFLGGWGPWGKATDCPADGVANARRNARVLAALGLAALAIGAIGGALGYNRMQTPPTHADLVLSTGAEPAPVADLVTVTGIAHPDLIVRYQETIGGSTESWSFVPLVSPAWRIGEPIRFLLRTNQTAWLPPAGTDALPTPRMLLHGNPPFRMVTEPSVVERHALPGAVLTAYEKARVPLDPSVGVVEQSEGEIYAPYWITAAGGGVVGACLLLGGLIGAINARKAGRA